MKLLKELLESFSDTKRDTGYHDTFIPINVTWLDGPLHFLRNEPSFTKMPKADAFADKVESFFNNKFGDMVYHKKDDSVISDIINANWTELQKNPTPDQMKLQIKFTNRALHDLKRRNVIAPEGSHSEETDFWADQGDKDRVFNYRSDRR